LRLLAKSPPRDSDSGSSDEAVFLPGHLRESYEAALNILECTALDQLEALGLAPRRWLDRFNRVASLAAALHDLGKANDHFQGILQDIPERCGRLQGLRHEWVTLLILSEPLLEAWLSPVFNEIEIEKLSLYCAITGHHPAYNRPSPPLQATDGTGSEIKLYLRHPDFVKSLEFVAGAFALGKPPILQESRLSLLADPTSAFSRIQKFFMEAEATWEEIGAEEQRFIAAVKACLIAADAAGSTLPRKLDSLNKRMTWIRRAFAETPTPAQLGEIVQIGLSGNELRSFQKTIAEQAGEVTFVKAGCGSGKTLAAYHWARMRCPGKRLYFCYPTTGTATEGYRDYLFDFETKKGRFGAELFHGRADIDLDIILNVERDIEPFSANDAVEDAFARIESLNAWSTPIVSCTVDTVLGIIQNHRRGLYSWPALSGAAFVFDEIHAYDQRLFGALLCFLESVRGVPVLLMTASLPKNRLAAIQERLFKRGASLSMPQRTEDLIEFEERPRYRSASGPIGQDPLLAVLAEARSKGKILWVCNTIDRTMDAATRAFEEGLKPIIYHSRFRYEDRVRRHKQVIEAFLSKGSALAICSQVAEMSLDLSATLLVTDLAPVPALIQRLGRLNRRARRGDAVKPFIVVEPLDRKGKPLQAPYDKETYGDWQKTSRQWLAQLPHDSISQADLANHWENLQAERIESTSEPSAWLAGGPITRVLELRKGNPGVNVIMERDCGELKTGRKRLAEVVLPMPPPPNELQWKKWTRHNGVPIAPESTIDYDKSRGARWQ